MPKSCGEIDTVVKLQRSLDVSPAPATVTIGGWSCFIERRGLPFRLFFDMGANQKRVTVVAATLMVWLAAAALTAVAADTRKPKPTKKRAAAEEIFDNKHILPLKIEIEPAELKRLQQDNRHFVRATIREGTNVWKDVGVHLKGAAGSFRGIEDRPALTMSFTKFTPDQTFHGLRKLHLNNSVQDGSLMTENICGELFRKAGVPAARVSYATVEINGRSKGLYVLKEGFAKEMLGLYFKNTKGNLYDGGFLRDITEPLERDSGDGDDVNNWADLKELVKACQEQDAAKRFAALDQVLDLDRFISFSALEMITDDWDGYIRNRNNYRIYHDLTTGKMVFIPHGMDQMFWNPQSPILGNVSALAAQAVLTTPQGIVRFHRRFGEVFTNVFQLEVLTNRVAELAALIRPALTNLHGPGAGREYDGQIARMRDLITARWNFLAAKLAEPKPKPLALENGVAKVTGWAVLPTVADEGNATRDQTVMDSRRTLHIQTSSTTTASWRVPVLLESGIYRLEAMAKTKDVVPVRDLKKGEGAGVRIHGSQTPRPNKLVGTTDWQKISYEFEALPELETTLVCELRASRGEAWFDLESLKVVKIK